MNSTKVSPGRIQYRVLEIRKPGPNCHELILYLHAKSKLPPFLIQPDLVAGQGTGGAGDYQLANPGQWLIGIAIGLSLSI
ncbi:MAG: hypothetical protein V3T54_03830, partial [Acidobacteriota bacterium]